MNSIQWKMKFLATKNQSWSSVSVGCVCINLALLKIFLLEQFVSFEFANRVTRMGEFSPKG
jgi:hypothetical protein